MQKSQIKIGTVYAVKIGKNTIGVRIMKQTLEGTWEGINVSTNKPIEIKSADRLVGLYDPKAAKKTPKTPHVEKKTAEPSGDTTGVKEPKQGGLSGAVRVLQEAGKPMNCQEMVKIMLEKGYWKSEGRTPSATVYSAIIREIKEKGAAARFRKTERGKFELAK